MRLNPKPETARCCDINKSRPYRIQFRVNQQELNSIEEKRKESGMLCRETFMRKLVMQGVVMKLDIPELRFISATLGRCAGSLNQIARRVNNTGRLYEGELEETREALAQTTEELKKVYKQLMELKT